jgi:hypothetical protein
MTILHAPCCPGSPWGQISGLFYSVSLYHVFFYSFITNFGFVDDTSLSSVHFINSFTMRTPVPRGA